jgi:hypothetical protein
VTHAPIALEPLVTELPLERLQREHVVLACDCYVGGIEAMGESMPWGWRVGKAENIDHHAAVERFARDVSSANLALLRVASVGVAPNGAEVVLTHTDCDSVLTAGIVTGRLAASEHYGAAAIAADHTGAENAIADLLQAIQDTRDVEYSLEMLALLERGASLPTEAQAMLKARLQMRSDAARMVAEGRFQRTGNVWWAEFESEIDGEFLPSLLPEAELIVVASPNEDDEGRWNIKVRRGMAMPSGRTLDHLPLNVVDRAYGGRWNAGSTKRGGGSGLSVSAWVGRLIQILAGG